MLGKAVTKAVPYAGAAGQTLSKLGSAIESGGGSLGGRLAVTLLTKTANALLCVALAGQFLVQLMAGAYQS